MPSPMQVRFSAMVWVSLAFNLINNAAYDACIGTMQTRLNPAAFPNPTCCAGGGAGAGTPQYSRQGFQRPTCGAAAHRADAGGG